jgi:predicted Zn finger-like uncharacterized protein
MKTQCPNCFTKYPIQLHHLEKKTRCKNCNNIFTIYLLLEDDLDDNLIILDNSMIYNKQNITQSNSYQTPATIRLQNNSPNSKQYQKPSIFSSNGRSRRSDFWFYL